MLTITSPPLKGAGGMLKKNRTSLLVRFYFILLIDKSANRQIAKSANLLISPSLL